MDAVYLVREGLNEELRYSLRSLVNVPHGRVWIVGWKPGWVRAEHLPLRQGSDRYENTLAGVLTACTHPDITDSFQLWNDDFYALAPTEIPVWHLGPVEDDGARGASHPGGRGETFRLLRKWGVDPVLDYAVHVPFIVDKAKMVDVLRKAAPHGVRALHRRTLYGNHYQIGGVQVDDVAIGDMTQIPKPGQVWAATNDQSFTKGAAGKWIRNCFPDPSPYEESP